VLEIAPDRVMIQVRNPCTRQRYSCTCHRRWPQTAAILGTFLAMLQRQLERIGPILHRSAIESGFAVMAAPIKPLTDKAG
jgi:hypothetical protein